MARRADLIEMDRSEVARCFTRKIFLPRTVSGEKNYAPVTLLERNVAMTRRLIILTLPACEFLMPRPSKPTVEGGKEGKKGSAFFRVFKFLPVPETYLRRKCGVRLLIKDPAVSGAVKDALNGRLMAEP